MHQSEILASCVGHLKEKNCTNVKLVPMTDTLNYLLYFTTPKGVTFVTDVLYTRNSNSPYKIRVNVIETLKHRKLEGK